jgi:beta-phosphoglucomutase-like phosphatase (HAD superfamily)
MIKAVIFDIDGTLLDSVDLHAESWARAFAHFGVSADVSEVRRHIGEGGDRLMPAFLPENVPQSRMDEIDGYRARLFKREYLPRVAAFPGVRALFERIRSRGLKIVLGSSCKRDEITQYKSIAQITDLIDGETTADDAQSSKPAPDIFVRALECVRPIAAAEAVVIGDTPYDAEAARKAHIPFIGMRCGGWSERDLRKPGCITVYRDPAELLAAYDRSPLAAATAGGQAVAQGA